MPTMMQDLRYALRNLRKNPGFTIVAVLTLALGIGANTAIFSVVNTVLLRPLAYPEPNRIVQVISRPSGETSGLNLMSVPMYIVWREQTQAFRDFAAYEDQAPGINLTGGDRPEALQAARVSADYFQLFGARVAMGRTFSAEEDRPGGPRLVVIGDGLWRRRFGSDRNLVGKAILLGGEPYAVIGILSPGFTSDPPAEIWLPLQANPNSTNLAFMLHGAARLKSGNTLDAAKAQMRVAVEQFQRKFPGIAEVAGPHFSFTVEPMRDVVVGDVRSALLVLAGAVSFVLLIACTNVANLLLARATGRRREMAIRTALGAGRRRIASQLLAESVLLSLAGGALGLILGYAGVRALLAFNPGDIPRIGAQGSAVMLDWRVLLFTLIISLFTGILFGVMPAFSASRGNISSTLNESSTRSTTGLRQNKTRSILVVTEIALALVLLAGATLLIRTFVELQTVDPGFDTTHVLTLEMSLAEPRFAQTAAVAQLVQDAQHRVEAIPGVEVLATTIYLPFKAPPVLPIAIESRPSTSPQSHAVVQYRQVSWRYFEALKIPLIRGRMFTNHDDRKALPVVLISQSMAAEFWPKANPVGEWMTIGKGAGPEFEEPPRQIIGVVADVRDTELSQSPAPTVYVPGVQLGDALTMLGNNTFPIVWVVSTKTDPYLLSADVQRELRIASGGLPVEHIRSLQQLVRESTARTNFNMMLLSIFAGVALLLATIGIYGLMAYSVQQRTHEIGIRMALGARPNNVLLLVLREGLSLALAGITLGLLGAGWLTQAVKSLLFRVNPNDPLTFSFVAVLLLSVAVAATYIPARRATKVDPVVALRYE
jgi:putative ABC transport system permease protein